MIEIQSSRVESRLPEVMALRGKLRAELQRRGVTPADADAIARRLTTPAGLRDALQYLRHAFFAHAPEQLARGMMHIANDLRPDGRGLFRKSV